MIHWSDVLVIERIQHREWVFAAVPAALLLAVVIYLDGEGGDFGEMD